MDHATARIVSASLAAPSGDNTQPVRFFVDEVARTIALTIDPSRDPSPMNAGQRMSRMAAGAALENLIRAAESLGLSVELEPGTSPTLAVARLIGQPHESASSTDFLTRRLTNRRPYDGRLISAEVIEGLTRATGPWEGVVTSWIVDRCRIGAFAGLVGRADALMLGEPSMRRAFLANLRFDQAPRAPVAEGLSLGSIEANFSERLALRAIRRTPDRLLERGRVASLFGRKARQMVRSASGLCLVVAPDSLESTDLTVGRALQRAWLALSAGGISAQPVMSLMILENLEEQGNHALTRKIGPGKLASLREGFRAIAPEIGDGRPAWLMRFGHAPAPTGRTGRLPVESVVLDRDPSPSTIEAL